MKLRHLLTLLATGSLLSVASAQYTGTNDFSTNNIGSLGQYSLAGTGVGAWSVTSGYLEYTSSLENTSRVLMMNNDTNTAYNEDWTASLTVTNLTNPSAGYNLIGLQVFAANNLDLGLFGAYAINSFSGGPNLRVEKASGPGYVLTGYGEDPAMTDLTDLTLRMTHNAATHDITISYSNDGATFYDSIVFNPGAEWSGAPVDGFSFRILALSSVDQISAGQMYADNFAVSAIPEPSTYAALAGLGALGLALWRRRQAKSAA